MRFTKLNKFITYDADDGAGDSILPLKNSLLAHKIHYDVLNSFFESIGLVVEWTEEAEANSYVYFGSILSKSYNGEVSPETWVSLKNKFVEVCNKDLEPFVHVSLSTYKYQIEITFSKKNN